MLTPTVISKLQRHDWGLMALLCLIRKKIPTYKKRCAVMNAVIYIVRCPTCGTGNRIPVDKEGLTGHCGSCKATLPPMYCHPQQMTDWTFDSFISSYSGPVLAEFWAPT